MWWGSAYLTYFHVSILILAIRVIRGDYFWQVIFTMRVHRIYVSQMARMTRIFAAFAAYNVTQKARKLQKGFVLRRSFVVTQIARMAQMARIILILAIRGIRGDLFYLIISASITLLPNHMRLAATKGRTL